MKQVYKSLNILTNSKMNDQRGEIGQKWITRSDLEVISVQICPICKFA